jgi:hypothetical protein
MKVYKIDEVIESFHQILKRIDKGSIMYHYYSKIEELLKEEAKGTRPTVIYDVLKCTPIAYSASFFEWIWNPYSIVRLVVEREERYACDKENREKDRAKVESFIGSYTSSMSKEEERAFRKRFRGASNAYQRLKCKNDTDGDGNCGMPACPTCKPELI